MAELVVTLLMLRMFCDDGRVILDRVCAIAPAHLEKKFPAAEKKVVLSKKGGRAAESPLVYCLICLLASPSNKRLEINIIEPVS